MYKPLCCCRPRTRPTSSRPSWRWPPKSRTGSARPRPTRLAQQVKKEGEGLKIWYRTLILAGLGSLMFLDARSWSRLRERPVVGSFFRIDTEGQNKPSSALRNTVSTFLSIYLSIYLLNLYSSSSFKCIHLILLVYNVHCLSFFFGWDFEVRWSFWSFFQQEVLTAGHPT